MGLMPGQQLPKIILLIKIHFFVLSPAVVNGPIDISATDFSITPNSPAIDAGDPSYSPIYDFG